jgi:hypothetical protein
MREKPEAGRPKRNGDPVMTYKAMYRSADGGVHAEVPDFAGAITCGTNRRRTAVPRHTEVVNYTAVRICSQLGIPIP